MTTIKGNVVDFEFFGRPGNPPVPICFVANNLETNETIKQWILDDYPDKPPYETSAENLFIAYSSSAELSCHLALNWVFPRNILDLFIEFKNMANGHIGLSQFKSLVSLAGYYGIDGASATYKAKMRDRILQGSPYSDKEKEEILDYCELDVIITKKLFQKMLPLIDWPRAQLRGRYMAAVTIMERNGTPIDTNLYASIVNHWDEIKLQMIAEVNPQYNVYEGTVFKMENFKKYLNEHNILWERTPTGRLELTDDTFKSYSTTYPQLEMLRQLRYNLNKLKLHKLEIGNDGRNRTSLFPFGTKTSRNAPSSSTYIFGPAVWIRHLIKPEPGKALAYIDYKQQEVGIGAALSKDKQLSADYLSGDPYIAFGKAAYLLPPDATKDTHPEDREKFKTCFLATNYGMGVESFAKKANISISMAAKLLRYQNKTPSGKFRAL